MISCSIRSEHFENALCDLGDSVSIKPKVVFDKLNYTSLSLSYGRPWAHYLGGYRDRLLGAPLGLPDLRCTIPAGVKHKDYRGEVLG
jgi:hypothetical protein